MRPLQIIRLSIVGDKPIPLWDLEASRAHNLYYRHRFDRNCFNLDSLGLLAIIHNAAPPLDRPV
jgi:hypothetical protein